MLGSIDQKKKDWRTSMQPNEVRVEKTAKGSQFRIAESFNAAVPFIDRHLKEGRGAKPAIKTHDGETVTYAELAERVNRCGNALKGLGIAPGERLLMIVKDCPAFFYAFWGAIKAGIVPVPLNTLLRAKDYEFMIADSGCAAVVYSPEFAAEVEPAVAALATKPRHVLRTEGGERSLEKLIDGAPADLAPHPSNPMADCFWLYSSGSTGRPKGAIHRQRDMIATSQNCGVDILESHESDVFFSAAKLFFAYGLGNAMTFPLWVGGTAILLAARPTPELTFEVIKNFRPTLFFGVPTLYAALLQKAAAEGPVDASSLRLAVSAGEPLPAELYRRWRDRFAVELLDAPGSTEVLHCYLSPRPGRIMPGSVGEPVPGYAMRIVDEQGQDVADGVEGELWVRGRSTAIGYWQRREQTVEKMRGPWFASGDRYRRDAEGRYWHIGRADDMFKVAGEWCSATEVESALAGHDAVAECAVVPHPDGDGVLKPRAVVVLAAGATPGDTLAEELRRFVRDRLAHYKCPRTIDFVAELPKTATGKIQRYKLRGTLAAGG
jgi:benzoate-CoA ligase family protein